MQKITIVNYDELKRNDPLLIKATELDFMTASSGIKRLDDFMSMNEIIERQLDNAEPRIYKKRGEKF